MLQIKINMIAKITAT